MDEWVFLQRRDGSWSWRCIVPHQGEAQSRRRFWSFDDALADATAHGYRSGVSRIRSIGPVKAERRHSENPREATLYRNPDGTALRLRTNVRQHWTWELLSRDRHVLNRSEDFESREQCLKDAREKGLLG